MKDDWLLFSRFVLLNNALFILVNIIKSIIDNVDHYFNSHKKKIIN